jgi:hypothetical protein
MLAEKGLLVTALVRARDEAHFNMLLLGRRLNLVAAGSCCSSVEIFERLLASRKSGRLQPANGARQDYHVIINHLGSSLAYDMRYKSKT